MDIESGVDDNGLEISTPGLTNPGNIFTLCVEFCDEHTEYVVHTEFASYYSKVLREALERLRIDGEPLTYRLEKDTNDVAVGLLVTWIYTQNLDPPDSKDKDEILAELWILADKLCIVPLQNLAIDKLAEMVVPEDEVLLPIVYALETIYEKTKHGSVLRRFLVEICAHNLNPGNFFTVGAFFPTEFIAEYAEYVWDQIPEDIFENFKAIPASYHVVVEEE